jgi:hypothetical protein
MYYRRLFKQRELYSNKVISSSVQLTTHDKYKDRDKCLGSSGSLGTGVLPEVPKLISGNQNRYPNLVSGTSVWAIQVRVRVIRVWVMGIGYFA